MATPGRIVHGLHPVRELLRSSHQIDRIVLATSRGGSDVLDEIIRLAADRAVPVDRVEREEIDRRVGEVVHQGVIGYAPAFPYADLDDVVTRAEEIGERPLLVALDGITDPYNVGSIARTTEAAGGHGLVVPARRAAPITPTVEKAAAGALAHLPVVRVTNLVRALGQLQQRGLWVLGLEGDAEEELMFHPLASEPCVLVVGSEGVGLSRLVRERCDALVALPLRGRIESLNASVAAGIALFQLAGARA